MQTTIVIKDREDEVRLIAGRLRRSSTGRLSEKYLMAQAEQVMRSLEKGPITNLSACVTGFERVTASVISASHLTLV